MLKAAWVVEVVGWLKDTYGESEFVYVDPFAGMPCYPLIPRTCLRFESLKELKVHKVCEPFVSLNVWPSAAALAASGAEHGTAEKCLVFDRDEGRREDVDSRDVFLPAFHGLLPGLRPRS